MKTLATYTDYFSALVDNHKTLLGFYRTHFTGDPFGDHLALAEIMNALKSIKSPLLLLQAYDMNFVDRDSDNVLQNCKGAFWLLKPATFNNFDATEAAMSSMEVIAKQIMAFIKQDLTATYMNKLDIQYGDFTIERCGPIFDGFVGARVEFSYYFGVNSEVVYDSTMDQYWNTPPAES